MSEVGRARLGTVPGAAVAILTLGLAGCAEVPGLSELAPPPYTTPTPAPVVTPSDATPDGFSERERFALRVWSPTCESYRNGSAWMLDETHAVTNRHVVDAANEIVVTDYQGNRYDVVDASTSAEDDLALLTIEGTFPRAATLAEEGPGDGDTVWMSGYAGGGPLETLSGPFVETREDSLAEDGAPVYFFRIAAREGDSGSALTDIDGNVVGVVYAADLANHASAVTLDRLEAFLADEDDRVPVVSECV